MSRAAPSAPAAVEQWLRAMNADDVRARGEHLEAAIHPDAIVLRYGFDETRDDVIERLEGAEQIAAWLARSPAGTRFVLVGWDEAGSRLRYQVQVGGYLGAGTQAVTFDGQGRITSVRHRPDDLDRAQVDALARGVVAEA